MARDNQVAERQRFRPSACPVSAECGQALGDEIIEAARPRQRVRLRKRPQCWGDENDVPPARVHTLPQFPVVFLQILADRHVIVLFMAVQIKDDVDIGAL